MNRAILHIVEVIPQLLRIDVPFSPHRAVYFPTTGEFFCISLGFSEGKGRLVDRSNLKG